MWQGLASYWEMNVSSTHSIIGAIIGFSLVYGGKDAVNWATPDSKVSTAAYWNMCVETDIRNMCRVALEMMPCRSRFPMLPTFG